jgi:hypothetical protein
MNKVAKKKIIPIKSFKDLDGLTGGTDLQLNIDLSKRSAAKCNLLKNASNIIEYTEAYEKTIDYRLKYLKHPDSYIGLRPITESTYDFNNERSLKQISLLVCQGATVVFGLSPTTPFNTLYSLVLLSIFQILGDYDNPKYDYLEDEYTSCEYLLRSKSLLTPCLLGYNVINRHDELQWGLHWNPRLSDIVPKNVHDFEDGLRLKQDAATYRQTMTIFLIVI